MDLALKKLRKCKAAQTKTRTSNVSSIASATLPVKRAHVMAEDTWGDDNVGVPPCNQSVQY